MLLSSILLCPSLNARPLGCPACSDPHLSMRAAPDFSGFLRTRLRIRFDAWCVHVVLLDGPPLVLVGRICVISGKLGMYSRPIGHGHSNQQVRCRTCQRCHQAYHFFSDVQHWWRAMASNCMSQGRNCADTVPSNIGTLGLDE